jgi:hypothetical protein
MRELPGATSGAQVTQILIRRPTGLKGLYDRMAGQIYQLSGDNLEHCRHVLSTATTAYRLMRKISEGVLAMGKLAGALRLSFPEDRIAAITDESREPHSRLNVR